METLEIKTDQGLQIVLLLNSEYQIRRVERGGKERLVVPVVMMVEGVHNGNRGPLLHLAEEFGKSPEDWNGIPVTVHHPEDENGNNISANSPGVVSVGEVLNAHMDEDNKLRAEVWLDEQILKDTEEIAWEAITNMNPLEISTGLLSEEEQETGEWNGETYNAITRNPRPDHLALLPGETGACSWNDGCGIRANKEGGKEKTMERTINKSADVDKKQYLADLIANAELGYRETMSIIQSKLDTMDTDVNYHYLQEVHDDFFVYEVSPRGRSGPLKFYKRNYSVNETGEIEFATEEPTEVRKQTEYVALKEGEIVRTKFSNNNTKKEVNTMSEKKDKPCCEDVVDALIANKETKFTDEDKTWLLTLEENQLAKIVQDEVQEDPPEEETASQLNAEQARQIMKDSIKTTEDFMAFMPDGEMKDQMNTGLALHKQRREGMVKAIIANTEKDLWKEETLNGMDFNVLTKLYKSINTTTVDGGADYTLNAEPVVNESVEEPLLPPGVEVETAKE